VFRPEIMVEFKPTVIKKFPKGQSKLTPENHHWNLFKNTHTHDFSGIISQIRFSKLSPYTLAIANGIQTKLVTCVETFPLRVCQKLKDIVHCVDIRDDGKLVVQGGADKRVRVVTREGRTRLREFKGHTAAVRDCVFAPKNNILSVSDDGGWALWDIKRGTQISSCVRHTDKARTCGFVGEDLFFTGGFDHTVRLWDSRAGDKEIRVWTLKDHVNRCIEIRDHIAVACGPQVIILDHRSPQPLFELQIHRKGVMGLSKNKDGTRLISAGLDHFVKFSETQNYDLVHQMNYKAPLVDVALSDDNRHLAVGFASGNLKIKSYKGHVVEMSEIERAKEREDTIVTEFKELRRKAEAPPEKPKPGTKRWFDRGANSKAEEGDLVAPRAKRRKLMKHDQALRRFRYQEALSIVLESGHGTHIASVLNELWLRDGLDQSLKGRNEDTLVPLLKYLIKSIDDPRLSAVCIQVMDIAVQHYGHLYGQCPVLDVLWEKIDAKLNREINFRERLIKLQGSIECVSSLQDVIATPI